MLRAVFFLAAIIGATAFSRFRTTPFRCNPPSSLRARAELIGFDNDKDFDGVVTSKDLAINLMNYDKDGDVTQTYDWEVVDHWKCRYGFNKDFVEYFYKFLDTNGDGVWRDDDFTAPFFATGENFRQTQIGLFRGFCGTTNNTATDCEKLNQETNLDSFGNFSLPLSFYSN